MSLRTRLVGLLLLCAVVAVSSAAAGRHAPRLTVSSTIDGKKVLPLRTRWTARVNPSSSIARVDFLIDGKVRWIEHQAPYNYGRDDEHGHLGFLITTWLKPGRHTFSARAVDKSGQTGTDRVVARVLPAPAPPPSLAGMWTRTVTSADLKKAGPEPPPAGRWKLIFDRVGAWHLDPFGSGVVNQYDVAGGVIHVYAPIQMAPLINDHTTISRYGAHNIGGFDCREDGPFGSYRWSASGGTLTLTAIRERCGNRRAVWEGVWKRTS
jgi:hypothetical protein